MKTITVTKNIYTYQELEGEAKQKAKEWLCDYERFDYLFAEAFDSVQAFAKIFPIDIESIDFIEPYRNEYRLTLSDEQRELKGLRLRTYLINNYANAFWSKKYLGCTKGYTEKPIQHKRLEANWSKTNQGYYHMYYSGVQTVSRNCALTGVCYDENLLDPFWLFINKPDERTDFEDLIESAISEICKCVQDEIEYQCKDEALIEHCEANGYEFDENGKIV